MARPRVFISYSHKDQHWMDQLRLYLSGLEVDPWVDTMIEPGDAWRPSKPNCYPGLFVQLDAISLHKHIHAILRPSDPPPWRIWQQHRYEELDGDRDRASRP
jgi:hypothetical protein